MGFINDDRMAASLDRWITGNYGEDADHGEEDDQPQCDPGDDEPEDFNERRAADAE